MSEDKIVISGLASDPKKREWRSGDKNVLRVIEQLEQREKKGLLKYGTTTERKDLSVMEWLQHLQEELMDAAVYIEKLKGLEAERSIHIK
jgi:hypothetical protein